MTTLAALNTLVSADLRDTGNLTFSSGVVDELINAALAEIGRIAPQRFQVTVSAIADTLSYNLSSATGVVFDQSKNIEVFRVELWDKTTTPKAFVALLQPRSAEYSTASAAGWEAINGTLYLTNRHESFIDPLVHEIRVTGYAPWQKMTASIGATFTPEEEYALRDYVRVEALRMLLSSRELFAQWQTASRNTDTTLAGLAGLLDRVESLWHGRSRRLAVLREAP